LVVTTERLEVDVKVNSIHRADIRGILEIFNAAVGAVIGRTANLLVESPLNNGRGR